MPNRILTQSLAATKNRCHSTSSPWNVSKQYVANMLLILFYVNKFIPQQHFFLKDSNNNLLLIWLLCLKWHFLT